MNKKDIVARLGSTIFLRGAVVLIGLVVLAFYSIAVPIAIIQEGKGLYLPILLGLYAPAVPFFLALYQAMKLLNYIDKNKAFSEYSIKALKVIRNCALAIAAIFTAGLPYIYRMAQEEDAPGVMLIGLVFVFAGVVVATFASVLQKLLQSAADLKKENDLTV